MKRVLIIISFLISLAAYGQSGNDFTTQQAKDQEIYIQFDKPFYLSGETLWYSLFNTTTNHRLIFGRRFMELALVDRNKQVVIKERIKVEDGRSAGQLQLPSFLTTGNYMLIISYPFEDIDQFLYRKMIKVFNPEELRSASPEENRVVAQEAGQVDLTESEYITLVADKRNYGARERVSLNITLKGFDQADLSVVVREKRLNDLQARDIRSITLDASNPEVAAALSETELTNYREKKALNWSVVDSHGVLLYELLQQDSLVENSIPYAYVVEDQVSLSIFEVRPGQFVMDATELTGDKKSFFFNNFTFNRRLINNMTHWTEKDMADNMGEMDFGWIVRPRDYAKVLSAEVKQSPQASPYVYDYAHRKRIKEDIYAGNAYVPVPDQSVREINSRMMYKPIFWKSADDYSEMVSVPEFLKEIVLSMKVWNNPRRKDVRLAFSGGRYNSAPLFLVNGVPTNDLEKVFDIPMQDVLGVGVIKDPQNQTQRDQVREVARYGYFGANGIIAIHMRPDAVNPFEGEYNGMLNKRLYIEPYDYPQPDYRRSNTKSPSPDFRPVLHWEPLVKARRGRAALDFFTSDDVGVYEIIVEGIGQNGEVIHARQSIMLGNPKLFSQE